MRLMIDIETLGINPNAPIISIGAVDSDGNVFHEYLDIQSQLEKGALVDWSTVHWWMQQDDAARDKLQEFGTSAEEVLRRFIDAYKWKDMEVWCNGLNFDLPIIESAFRRFGILPPWQYYNCRDFRTLKKLYPSVSLPRPAVAHDALEDAKAQMAGLLELLNEHKTRDIISSEYRKEIASQKGVV